MTKTTLNTAIGTGNSKTIGRITYTDLLESETYPLVLKRTTWDNVTAYVRHKGRLQAISGAFNRYATIESLIDYLTFEDEDGNITVEIN